MTQQKTDAGRVVLATAFPELPRLPRLTISADHAAMQEYERGLQQWYFAHKQAVIDNFEALAEEINKLKSAR